jgi:hypothetical protein
LLQKTAQQDEAETTCPIHSRQDPANPGQFLTATTTGFAQKLPKRPKLGREIRIWLLRIFLRLKAKGVFV